jgi:predicted kinase
MRKWMRERLKRRKKTEEPAKESGQAAPLQPAYFDAGASPTESSSQESVSKAEEAPELPAQEPASTERNTQSVGTDVRRRRRRRRGRRGRGGPGRTVEAGKNAARADTPVVDAVEQEPSPEKAPPRDQPSMASRAPRGVVVLAIGLPGSGKSSWFKRHSITPLSSDLLRALLFDDPTEQRFQDLIFSNLRSMLRARLIARRPTNYVDATNLTPHERHGWIKLAKDYGYEAQAVFFDVPVEVCLERNQRRERVVAEDVMRRMSAKLRAPTFNEGFTKITVVKVKKKEDIVPAETSDHT